MQQNGIDLNKAQVTRIRSTFPRCKHHTHRVFSPVRLYCRQILTSEICHNGTKGLLSRVRPSAGGRIFRNFYTFSGKCPAPRQHAPASSSVRASINEIQIRSYAASAQCHVLILHLKCIFCTLKPFILNCAFPDAASQQPGPSGTTTAIASNGSGGLNGKVPLISGSALFVKPSAL